MVTQRYTVVVNLPAPGGYSPIQRVFGPMSEERAETFAEGLRKRFPHLDIYNRPCHKATFTHAAAVIQDLL